MGVRIEPAAAVPVEAPASEAQPASTSDAPLTSDEVIALQQKLKALGFDVGTADGKIGRRTVTAVRAYQASRAMPITGKIDREFFNRVISQPNP